MRRAHQARTRGAGQRRSAIDSPDLWYTELDAEATLTVEGE